jgi:hypothetical protein
VVFERADCPELWHSAPAVIDVRLPWLRAAFERQGWKLPERIERVYDSSRAAAALGYAPRFGIAAVIDQAAHAILTA